MAIQDRKSGQGSVVHFCLLPPPPSKFLFEAGGED